MIDLYEIYGEEKTFLDELANDLDDENVWFNDFEFARYHVIDGERVVSIFTADRRTKELNIRINNDETVDGVTSSRGVLYVRAQEISHVVSGQALNLDGKFYTVIEADLIQDQVWRIVLGANN